MHYENWRFKIEGSRSKNERRKEREGGEIFSLSPLLMLSLLLSSISRVIRQQGRAEAREDARQAGRLAGRREARARGTRYADEGPNSASRLTNARMRPGANAHAAAAPAAPAALGRGRVTRSRLSRRLSFSFSPSPSLFNDLTGVQNTKLQPILRFVRPPRVWPGDTATSTQGPVTRGRRRLAVLRRERKKTKE